MALPARSPGRRILIGAGGGPAEGADHGKFLFVGGLGIFGTGIRLPAGRQ